MIRWGGGGGRGSRGLGWFGEFLGREVADGRGEAGSGRAIVWRKAGVGS